MRKDYIDWQTYFMGIAYLSGLRSKDPTTQVGACIVNNKKRIVGIGYNGFPMGCDDLTFPWGKTDAFTESKYAYVVHAELNAILNSHGTLDNCSIYVTHYPCNECAKAIIQSGIKRIYFANNKRAEKEETKAAKRMFDAAGVKIARISEFDVTITPKETEEEE